MAHPSPTHSKAALRVGVVLGSLLAAGPALAAPDCEALGESEFIALVLDGQAAVDRGNPDTHRGIVEELRGRIPCLAFVPRPRVFADYLVLDALAEFGTGGDWQTPLAAAVRIRPGVDRIVGGAHPISRFTPPDPGAPGERRPVPEGTRVFVDGEAASALPPTGELHLVQVTNNGLWRTQLANDEAVAETFLTEPIEAPLEWTWWGHAGVAVGAGGVSQRRVEGWVVEDDQNAFTPDQDRITAWPAIVARGGASYGLVGIAAELDVGLAGLARPVGSHAQVAVLVGHPSFRLGAGAGVGGSTSVSGVSAALQPGAEPQYVQSTDGMPYVLATAMHLSKRWDGGVTGGFGPAAVRGSMFVGYVRPVSDGDWPLRLGLSGSAQRGWFVVGENAADEVTSVTWRAGFDVGVRR